MQNQLTKDQEKLLSRWSDPTRQMFNEVLYFPQSRRLPKTLNDSRVFVEGNGFYTPNLANPLVSNFFQKKDLMEKYRKHFEGEVNKPSPKPPICQIMGRTKRPNQPFQISAYQHSFSAFMRKHPKPSEISKFIDTVQPLFPNVNIGQHLMALSK